MPLGSSEALYRHLVEQVPAVVYIDSNESLPRSLYLSPQVERLFGHPPEAWMQDPHLWLQSIHPDDRERVHAAWVEAIDTGAPFSLEYRMRHPDGRIVWTRDSAIPIRDEHGRIAYWQGLMHDITESKAAEQALRESEARHRALVENIPAIVYVVAPDDDRKTLYVSPQIESTLGYAQQEWLDQPDIWMELLHPDDREPTLAAHDLHNETGRPWNREYRLIASDGRAVWFRDVATLVRDEAGRPLHWQGVQLDITELKRAEEELVAARDELEIRVLERTHELEEANELMMLEIEERRRVEGELREARERYRLLAERIPGVTYVWDAKLSTGETVYVSPQVERILGFTPEEWGRAEFWKTRVHPDDVEALEEATRHSLATGQPFSLEYRYLAKDGRVVWVLDEATLLERDEDGRPRIFHGVMVDITDRKEAEAKAVETEMRYRTLAAQIPAIIYIWTPSNEPGVHGQTRYISPQVQTVLGFTQEEWTGTPDFWVGRLHPDDRRMVLRAGRRAHRTGQPFSLLYRVIAADGRIVWLRDEGRVLSYDEAGRPFEWQGIMLDVSEHEQDRHERIEAERRLRALVEQLPAIVYVEKPSSTPGETVLTYLSPQVEQILGYTAEELLADISHLPRLIHPEDRERVLRSNSRSEETGEPFDEEYRVLAKDGRIVWLHSRATLVRDERGEPLFWQGVALDVTAKHEMQDTLRRLEARSGAASVDQARSRRAAGGARARAPAVRLPEIR